MFLLPRDRVSRADVGKVNAKESEGELPGGIRSGDDGDPDQGAGQFVLGVFDFALVTTGGEPFDTTPDEVDKEKDPRKNDANVNNAEDKVLDTFKTEETVYLTTDINLGGTLGKGRGCTVKKVENQQTGNEQFFHISS